MSSDPDTVVVYISHEARDNKTPLSLVYKRGDLVADIRKCAEDRINDVFGSTERRYTVTSMRLTPGFKGHNTFILRDADNFWDHVRHQAEICLTCYGDIVEARAEDENEKQEEQQPRRVYFRQRERHGEVYVELEPELKRGLRDFLPFSELYKDGNVELEEHQLVAFYAQIVKQANNQRGETRDALRDLAAWLEKKTEKRRAVVANMIKDGVISFWDLGHFYEQEKVVFTVDQDGQEQGYIIKGTKYATSFFGPQFEIKLQYISTNGQPDSYFKAVTAKVFKMFEGVIPIERLGLQYPTEAEKERIITRNKEISKVCSNGCYHANFNGVLSVPLGWRGTQRIFTDGRVMIDIENYNRSTEDSDYDSGRGGKLSETESLSDPDLMFTFIARLPAFSFRLKRWGTIAWNDVSPIKWNHSAFDALVMRSDDQKELIRGLVEQRLVTDKSNVSEDVISGKGAGCIFLLYGPPGTGKTLTAEATAELLERPLYQISIAELGTSADKLESGLQRALRLASHWRAVVLLDEADNFLERRGKNDLERNAMVSVFLKLLEYYEGVLFLTTNRVEEFDSAFYSRISMPIMYPELDEGVRFKVWTNLLRAANTKLDNKDPDHLTVERLSTYELNGREIRSAIYLAQCTAQRLRQDPSVLYTKDLMVPIDMKIGFRSAMEEK